MAIETQAHLGEPPVTTAALWLENVSVQLGERQALRDVSLTVEQGAFVGLIGPNGSGKSTLLRTITGVVTPATGRVLVGGLEPSQARDRFSYLPQRQQLALDLPIRARDVVMMGRIRHMGWFRPAGREDREAVDYALDLVGLTGRARSPIGEMSFGQQQRVFFARALAQAGDIILLDEPMNGVDPQTQALFVELLMRFHREGKTIVMATHDLNQAAAMCDSICVVNQTLVAYGPVHEVLTEGVLREAYGVHLHFAPDHHGTGHLLGDVHHHETPAQ